MAKSPEEMAAAMEANMKEKTGKTLRQWFTIAKRSGETRHGAVVKHLKGEHGLTHGYANLVAHRFLAPAEDGGDPIETLYQGPKAALRPIHDAIIKAVKGFGADVELAPKKTYVSLLRSKQFALVQPSTRTRVDLGLKLPGEAPGDRLEASGSFNSMVTHRVRLSGPEDVDAEVIGWLRAAYERA